MTRRSIFLLTLTLLALFTTNAWAGKKTSQVSKEVAQLTVTRFVDALNSMDTSKALKTLAPSDRMVLGGKDDLLGLISESKLLNPKVEKVESIHENNRLIGAKVTVSLEEIDPLDATRVPKRYTWVLVKEGKTYKVSVMSLWMAKKDAEK